MSVTAATNSLPMAPEPDLYPTVGKKSMERADFLKLFITQLQYQDPMEPMDTFQMSSQLNQFTSLDATLKMSDNMEKLLEYQTSQNNLQLLGLLDHSVQTRGDMMAVNEGTVSATEFEILDMAETSTVEIYTSGGKMIKQIDLGANAVGVYELNWDGTDNAGNIVTDGAYSYKVRALDANGNKVDVDYKLTGKVTGVEFDGGKAMLTLDKYLQVGVSEISRVLD